MTRHSASLPLTGAPKVELRAAASPGELEAARAIIRDYGASLGIDLDFQNFEAELAGLPGDYAAPRGVLLLALVGSGEVPSAAAAQALARSEGGPAHVAGCCALRPLDNADYPNAAEMKRLYVRPGFRGLGLGRRLAEAILDEARAIGYGCVLLDTLDDMESARALYEELGFVEVPPYYHNPIAGSHYLKAEI